MFEEVDWGDVGLLVVAEVLVALLTFGGLGVNWLIVSNFMGYKGTYWDMLNAKAFNSPITCLLYTSPSPRD